MEQNGWTQTQYGPVYCGKNRDNLDTIQMEEEPENSELLEEQIRCCAAKRLFLLL